jgi:hypothetical protein
MNAPIGLGEKALELWDGVMKSYRLRPDELRLLEDACREIDIIERLDAAVSKPSFKLTVRGSMGQNVINPILQEVRQHRIAFASLARQLKLPSLAGGIGAEGEETPRGDDASSKARKAAAARWGNA